MNFIFPDEHARLMSALRSKRTRLAWKPVAKKDIRKAIRITQNNLGVHDKKTAIKIAKYVLQLHVCKRQIRNASDLIANELKMRCNKNAT